jgi:hypothetical protein
MQNESMWYVLRMRSRKKGSGLPQTTSGLRPEATTNASTITPPPESQSVKITHFDYYVSIHCNKTLFIPTKQELFCISSFSNHKIYLYFTCSECFLWKEMISQKMIDFVRNTISQK